MGAHSTSRLTAVVSGIALSAALAFVSAPAASAHGIDDYHPANPADYAPTDSNHYGWLFFRTPDGRNCGMAPNGGQSGCDAVPYDAPAGKNQTVVSSWAMGTLITSPGKTFTQRNGQHVLPEGYKLVNQGTVCGMTFQGVVNCKVAQHYFALSTTYMVGH